MARSTKEYDTGAYNTESDDSIDVEHARSSMNQSAAHAGQSEGSCLCCLFKLVVLPTIVLIFVTGLGIYFVGGNESLPTNFQGILPDVDLFRQEDPTMGEIYLWRQEDGSGLDLTILNALDSDWYPFFNTAVQEWDNGAPDSLTLTTVERQPDSSCSVVTGVLKICNGDYGDTDWKGVNKLYLQGERIMSSIGKMNEFHFAPGGDTAKRQYTMCHEIGHGFGLPHTDETFWNRDQGNCMDYTSRPQNNMQPDDVNFSTLAEVYGIVGSLPDNIQQTAAPVAANEKENEDEEDKDDRKLKKENLSLHPPFSERVLKSIKVIDEMIETGNVRHGENGWRLLHETKYGRALEIDIEEDFTVQVHYLLV